MLRFMLHACCPLQAVLRIDIIPIKKSAGKMRFLLSLSLVTVFGSIPVSAFLSEKIKFSVRPTITNCRRRDGLSLSNHAASIQSDSSWWQVVADEKKFSLPKAVRSMGPRQLKNIEGLWNLIRESNVRRIMKQTIQKVIMFCTLSASLLVIRSQKAFAAAAPLVKNVKVRGDEEAQSNSQEFLIWQPVEMLSLYH